MSRSVRVRLECIETVKLALRRNGYARQSDLGEKVEISKNTVNKFFNGKPIDCLNFIEICTKLSLDWQEIADLEHEELAQNEEESNTREKTLSVTVEVNRDLEVNLADKGDTPTNQAREKRVILQQAIPNVPVWKGRDELLHKLTVRLLPPETLETGFLNAPKVLAIIGQGGIGKTSLAVKLIENLTPQPPSLRGKGEKEKEKEEQKEKDREKEKAELDTPPRHGEGLGEGFHSPYECVMYFKAQEGTSFDDVAEFLLDGLGIETPEPLKTADEKIGKIIAGLAENCCLLVLDNLESVLHPANHPQAGKAVSSDWGKLLNALVYQQHISQTILTSREVPADLADTRYEGAEPDTELVHIETLTGVSDRAGVEILQQRQLKDKPEDLQWVSGRVEGHVFLLTQLAALGKGKPGYLRKHPEFVTKKAEPILQEQLARQSDAARDLLKRMCVLRVPIDVRGLTFLRLYTDDREKDDRFLNAAKLGEPAELTEEEIRETEAILERLVDSSLVQCGYDEEKCELFYDLHRVIVDFLQEIYQDELFNPVRSAYLFYLSLRNVENPKSIEELQPVLQAFFYSWLLENYKVAASLLLGTIDKYLRRWGYWNSLKELYEEILPNITGSLRLKCLDKAGLLYRDLGELDIAKQYFNEALLLIKDEDNAHAQQINMTLFLIKLEEMLQQAYKAEQEQINQFDKEIGNNDTYDESLESLEYDDKKSEVNVLFPNILKQGINSIAKLSQDIIAHSTGFSLEVVAIAMAALGRIKINEGEIEEAKELLIKALQIFEELQIQKSIAETNYDLARLYRQRNNPEAQQHYNTAHQIFQELGAAKDLERIEKEWQDNADTPINES